MSNVINCLVPFNISEFEVAAPLLYTHYKGRQCHGKLFCEVSAAKKSRSKWSFGFVTFEEFLLVLSTIMKKGKKCVRIVLLFSLGFKTVFFVGPVRHSSELHHLLLCKWTRHWSRSKGFVLHRKRNWKYLCYSCCRPWTIPKLSGTGLNFVQTIPSFFALVCIWKLSYRGNWEQTRSAVSCLLSNVFDVAETSQWQIGI